MTTKNTKAEPKKQFEELSLEIDPSEMNNEVYDDGEIASVNELNHIIHALKNHKAKVAPETHPDFDGNHCIECGEKIPEKRLNLGRIRCYECQTALEKKNKQYGR